MPIGRQIATLLVALSVTTTFVRALDPAVEFHGPSPFTVRLARSMPQGGATPPRGIPGQGLIGHWQGSLPSGPVELRLVLHVETGSSGTLTGTLDSIDQGVTGIAISGISLQDGAARIELARIRGTFTGRLSADGSQLEGRWTQGPVDTPIIFRRLAVAPASSRPQDPKPPYPYDERMVSFEGAAANVRLAGTLTIPSGDGPFPAVVLLSGSGAQDRDEALMGHRPFFVLADHLSRKGIAVLRYDDRGVARSTGNFGLATHEDFAADARLAWRFLTAQPKIDATKVGLLGHSEGSVHASIAAVENKDVAFVVTLAGIGVSMDKLLVRQRQDLLRALGSKRGSQPEEDRLQDQIFDIVRTRGGTPEARAEIRALVEQIAAFYTPSERDAIGFTSSMLDQQVAILTSPWFVKLAAFDPAPLLARLTVPVLALNGEKDIQVAAEDNLNGIRRALAAGGNSDVTLVRLPELNHLFQHSRTGLPSEYGQIEETMSAEVLSLISDWILRRAAP